MAGGAFVTALDGGVLAASAAAIALVLWYFLGPRSGGVCAAADEGVQRSRIRVHGAYDPDRIVVLAGRPVRLEFYRDETNPCSEEVLLPSLRIHRDLPAFETTSVEFTPTEPGEIEFTCGMSMMRGRIVVQALASNA
jgi:plastocyanin domain-containing protein